MFATSFRWCDHQVCPSQARDWRCCFRKTLLQDFLNIYSYFFFGGVRKTSGFVLFSLAFVVCFWGWQKETRHKTAQSGCFKKQFLVLETSVLHRTKNEAFTWFLAIWPKAHPLSWGGFPSCGLWLAHRNLTIRKGSINGQDFAAVLWCLCGFVLQLWGCYVA